MVNGDCILLENYDENGIKHYGLIDSGQNTLQSFNLTGVKNEEQGKEDGFLAKHGIIPTQELAKKEAEEKKELCDTFEFFLISHCHVDHVGTDAKKAIAVLNNYKVKTLYIKEYDEFLSSSVNLQKEYEDIIIAAINNGTKVIGISPESLTNKVIIGEQEEILLDEFRISKSQTDTFKEYISNHIDNINNCCNAFNTDNIFFYLGSAEIKLINWEMFYNDGTIYESGSKPIYEENGKQRLKVKGENSNSLGLVLKQGEKKAFFGGDLNNTDDGAMGPEDRVKDEIGKVDLLKLNHHGRGGSNTENFLNTLKPSIAIASTIEGEMDVEVENWLRNNNVEFFYTTLDSDCVSVTIKEDEVFVGFHDTNCYKMINNQMYYFPEDYIPYSNYNEFSYRINYILDGAQFYDTITVTDYNSLNAVIKNDQKIELNSNIEKYEINNNTHQINIKPLLIKLSVASNNWVANESINIKENQNIQIINDTEEIITIKRGINLIEVPIFEVTGRLNLGKSEMANKIIIDGDLLESSSTLIKFEYGILELNDNVILCNNINKTTSITYNTGSLKEYSSFGSAIYCNNGTIEMNGGEIKNNKQYLDLSYSLPKELSVHYRFDTEGAGIFLSNNSKLNMYNGTICQNTSINNSNVNTNETYTNVSSSNRTITQRVLGVGIYSNKSEINFYGGEVSENTAINNCKTNLLKPKENYLTSLYSINDGIYGIGIYANNSVLNISDGFNIKSNNATLNNNIVYGDKTKVRESFISAIRGVQGYFNNTMFYVNGLNVDGQNSNVINHTNINKENSSNNINIDVSNNGGGLVLKNCTNFIIKDLNINNCKMNSINNGGALFIKSSNGKIDGNSIFSNNTTIGKGGAIYITSSEIDIINTIFNSNNSKFGGAIYSNLSDLKLENVKMFNNTTTGSGAGISSFGTNLIISGDNTEIYSNKAATFGGGIAINTSVVEFNEGKIKQNVANTYGDGVGIYSGEFSQNGGTIDNEIGINIENDGKYIIYAGDLNGIVCNKERIQIEQPDENNYFDKRNTSEEKENKEEENKEEENKEEENKEEENKEEENKEEENKEEENKEEENKEEENKEEKQHKTDSTVSEKNLPKTGKKMWQIWIGLSMMIILNIVFLKKYTIYKKIDN